MRILFICPYVPDLIRVRPYQFIRTLNSFGINIVLATVIASKEDEISLENLKPFVEEFITHKLDVKKSYINCLLGMVGDKPLQSLYSYSQRLSEKIQARLSQRYSNLDVDLIHVEHLRGGKYAEFLLTKMRNNQIRQRPLIWDSVDNISALFEQASAQSHSMKTKLISKFELNRTKAYEKKLVESTDRVLVTSKRDYDAFVDVNGVPNSKLRVVSNGVDLKYFKPGETSNRKEDTILISGKMSYHANIRMVHHFVDDIFPLITREKPNTKLWIVGKDPHSSIIAFGDDPRIIVTGQVPDMRPYLQEVSVSVAPVVYGAGIQNKVLEAMACATPVVTTPVADVSINGQNGVDYLVENNAEDFARAVIRLLNDQELRIRIGHSARSFVEANHNWLLIGDSLYQIYKEVVNISEPGSSYIKKDYLEEKVGNNGN